MGEALLAFFQPVWEQLFPKSTTPPMPPTVGGYPVDYSALTNAQIAAPAACDGIFETGNWVSVNRKAL
jgi:hypothetical protein